MAGRGHAGGILALLDLIEEHRPAFRYDWRTRFGKGLDESVPAEIGWSEALDLVRVLRNDPSSHIAAALDGHTHPLGYVGWMLADLIDIQGASAMGGKKWTAYPRPNKVEEVTRTRRGNAAGRAPDEVKAILSSRFGQPERPPI